MSVQPLWWGQVGLGFVRGVGEDAAVPMEQVKAALWGWSNRDRRGNRRSSSLEVEDGAAEPGDGEMDDGSSSTEVDEGRRAVAVDDVVGEEAPAGQW